MALVKSKNLGNGYTAEYWRIIRINALIDGSSEVLLALYKDRETRETHPEGYLDVKTFQFPIPKEKLVAGNAFEYAYAQISASQMSPDTVDEQGNPVPGAEQNWFADAVLA